MPGQLPELLMVGPNGNRKRYRLVVIRLYNKDALGRPHEGVIGFNDSSFVLEGHEHFITAYIPDELDYTKDQHLPLFED